MRTWVRRFHASRIAHHSPAVPLPGGAAYTGAEIFAPGFVVALLRIRLVGDPILREKGHRITLEQLRAVSMQRLIDNMIETMRDAGGVGLAAQQVGHPLKLLVIEQAVVEEGADPLVLVNGEIVKCTGSRRVEEGCLSIPGYKGEIARCVRV